MQIKYKTIIGLFFLILFIVFLGTFVCRYSFSSEKDMNRISELMSNGNYAQAIAILEKTLKGKKDDEAKAKLNYLIATCYGKQGNLGKAIYYYKETLNEKKSDFAVLARFQLAKYYQNLKNYELAMSEFKTILSD
ncbi:MAG: tetratricopeptide repeat protein [bacterium]